MNVDEKTFPNLYEYDNYRKFLKDAYLALKAKDKKFSFRYFARVAGFNSHNFLRLIIDGKSNMSLSSVDKMIKFFKLTTEEARFFQNLVMLNQAKTNEEKQSYAKEILRSQTYRKIHPLNESKYEFFAHWYVSAVRELVALPRFKEDPVWIAQHVVPPIKTSEAKNAIEDLLNLGLIKRDENGKLIQSEALLTTPLEVSSAYIANWHKEYLKRATESIDLLPRESRDISAVTFGFSKKNIKILKEMIANFRKGILHLASQQDDKDVLMQLNIQVFLLGETESDEEA
jgi:uncharacterized protein (TIGR02147 family)